MLGSDKALPKNSQQNLNKKLDRAVEETFPSSDPVSVSITRAVPSSMIVIMMRPNTPRWRDQILANKARPRASCTRPRRSPATWGAPSRRPLMTPSPREAVMFGKRWATTRRWSITHKARKQSDSRLPHKTLLVGFGLGYALAWMIRGSGSGRRERTEPAMEDACGGVGLVAAGASAAPVAAQPMPPRRPPMERVHHPSNRPLTHQKPRAGKHPNQKLYTLNSPPTVSSAWRSCVPQVGTQSPRSLRLAEANAPYPNR